MQQKVPSDGCINTEGLLLQTQGARQGQLINNLPGFSKPMSRHYLFVSLFFFNLISIFLTSLHSSSVACPALETEDGPGRRGRYQQAQATIIIMSERLIQ